MGAHPDVPYLTERMLHQSAALAPLGQIAVQHRERLDGSGYPRGLSGGAISRPARVLGAADAYASMREPRPHRPGRPDGEAAEQMRAEVRAGHLDGAAVDAVLEAAGHRLPRRKEGLSGLTAREVEVLILLARGAPNVQDAGPAIDRSGDLDDTTVRCDMASCGTGSRTGTSAPARPRPARTRASAGAGAKERGQPSAAARSRSAMASSSSA